MRNRSYYLLYKDNTQINYIYLLKMYQHAQSYDSTLIKNIIVFSSMKELAEKVNIKYSTLRNILNDVNYEDYFTVQKNQIVIHNNFKGKKDVKYIILNQREVDFLILKDNNLLAKYFIYHKYYCGFSSTGKHNSTAKQILETMGYSKRSNNYISQLSEFNKILKEENLICMFDYTENGKHRIFYYFA